MQAVAGPALAAAMKTCLPALTPCSDTARAQFCLPPALQLANVAGLPMARCGGMKVVARQLQLHKVSLRGRHRSARPAGEARLQQRARRRRHCVQRQWLGSESLHQVAQRS